MQLQKLQRVHTVTRLLCGSARFSFFSPSPSVSNIMRWQCLCWKKVDLNTAISSLHCSCCLWTTVSLKMSKVVEMKVETMRGSTVLTLGKMLTLVNDLMIVVIFFKCDITATLFNADVKFYLKCIHLGRTFRGLLLMCSSLQMFDM